MQIVIDISKEEYQTYINHTEAILDKSTPLVHQDLLKAVINGTPLPENHGRLIDISEYEKYFNTAIIYDDGNHEHVVYTNTIPTIIEGSESE